MSSCNYFEPSLLAIMITNITLRGGVTKHKNFDKILKKPPIPLHRTVKNFFNLRNHLNILTPSTTTNPPMDQIFARGIIVFKERTQHWKGGKALMLTRTSPKKSKYSSTFKLFKVIKSAISPKLSNPQPQHNG